MSKIARATQLIFGSNAGVNQIEQFGSLAAGSPVYTTSIATIQALSNYLVGWFGGVVGANLPAIEDLNALCYLFAYQLAYIFQAGISEWDSGTTYYTNSFVQSSGILYVSLVDTNLNNAVTDTTKWKLYNTNQISVKTTTYVIVQTDDVILADPTAGSFSVTLPAAASTSKGKRFTVKNIATNGNQVTLTGNAAELIDTANTLILNSNAGMDSATVVNSSTQTQFYLV